MSNIDLYTRPGCPWCLLLRTKLRLRGVQYNEINIWRDEQARALVRAAADGNETVPTVQVGGHWLVNPTLRAVLSARRGGDDRR